MVKLAPSILSADFAKLGEEVKEVTQAGADYIHVDVMDGHFVPNITIGPLVVEALRPITSIDLDVHLMIEKPERYIQEFADAGASIITVHYEASVHLHRTIQLIKSHGVKAGVAINPSTPVTMLEPILDEIDLALVMTVNPGFGGQSLIESTLGKVEQLATWKSSRGYRYEIEVDGGVNAETAKLCTDAGAEVLVAGSAIFNKDNRSEAIKALRQSILD